jgi:hypothetical protein
MQLKLIKNLKILTLIIHDSESFESILNNLVQIKVNKLII